MDPAGYEIKQNPRFYEFGRTWDLARSL